jgi:hypothetical protein
VCGVNDPRAFWSVSLSAFFAFQFSAVGSVPSQKPRHQDHISLSPTSDIDTEF